MRCSRVAAVGHEMHITTGAPAAGPAGRLGRQRTSESGCPGSVFKGRGHYKAVALSRHGVSNSSLRVPYMTERRPARTLWNVVLKEHAFISRLSRPKVRCDAVEYNWPRIDASLRQPGSDNYHLVPGRDINPLPEVAPRHVGIAAVGPGPHPPGITIRAIRRFPECGCAPGSCVGGVWRRGVGDPLR